jgi:hypothetical protein
MLSTISLSEKTMIRWAPDGGLSLSRRSSSSSPPPGFAMSAEEMDRLVAEWHAFRAKVGADAKFAPPEPKTLPL